MTPPTPRQIDAFQAVPRAPGNIWIGRQSAARRRPAVVLALVAVVVSIAALSVTALTAYQAGRAAGISASQQGPPSTASTPTAGAPATETLKPGTPTPGGAPSDIDPGAHFNPAYQPQQLELRPGAGCIPIEVDLDEPRVNVVNGADLSLRNCNGTPVLDSGRSTVALVTDPTITPGECAAAIRTGGLPTNITLPVRPGTVLCVATSRDAALAQGITWKIAVLDILTVAADDTVILVVSAWNAPS